MDKVADEKTILQGCQGNQTLHNQNYQNSERSHRFRKAIGLFGLTCIILWLLHSRGEEPHTMVKVMDVDESRRRRIDTGSNSLNGEFDLLDLLSIRSISGSISIDIHPQPAAKDSPEPAELLVSSRSGQVSVDFPALSVPDRDYRVSLDSEGGSIDGHIIHGTTTSITSKSGSLGIEVTPFTAGDSASTLRTSTKSGSQRVSLLSPAKAPGVSITSMSSSHSAESGSLTLRYPREWEGTIEGHTKSGSLDLHGRGLDIIRQGSAGKVGHYVLAKKGNGSSTLDFNAGSGSVNIYFD